MTLLPFFRQDNGLGTKPPPDNKGRSKLLASSATMGRRHRLSKLSFLLILSMSASVASQNVLQQHPKRQDLLEAKLFDIKKDTQQTRNVDSDGGNIMTVSTIYWFVKECIA